jgi:hypothetical protein
VTDVYIFCEKCQNTFPEKIKQLTYYEAAGNAYGIVTATSIDTSSKPYIDPILQAGTHIYTAAQINGLFVKCYVGQQRDYCFMHSADFVRTMNIL